MKNTIRCCISCILPCGSLDVIRIVHSNGRVEELSERTIKAEEIIKAHPKHVLKKPSSSSSSSSEDQGICPKIVIVPPDADLQRGQIYFLIPIPSSSTAHQKGTQKSRSRSKKKRELNDSDRHQSINGNNNNNSISMTDFLISDRYLSEILSESQRDGRRGRAGVWRPHLESISETPSEVY